MKNFKRTLTALVLIVALTPQISLAAEAGSTSASVSEQEGSISIIPVLGGTSMNLTGLKDNGVIPSEGTSSKSGSMIGVLGGYKLGFWDSTLEAGLMYMETGTKVDAFIAAIETTVSYLAIPINLRVPAFAWGQTRFHGKVGIMPSLLLSAEQEGTGLLASDSSDIKDEFNSFDVIAQAGFGASYPIYGQFNLHADLAYLRGFTEVTKDGGGYNEGFSLALALAISI